MDDYRAASVEQQLSARLAHAAADVRRRGRDGFCSKCLVWGKCKASVLAGTGLLPMCEKMLPRELLLQPRKKGRGKAKVKEVSR